MCHVQCAVCHVQYSVWSEQCAVCRLFCRLKGKQAKSLCLVKRRDPRQNYGYCTLHNAHCTLHNAHCTLQTAHCTLHNAHCTLHTANSTVSYKSKGTFNLKVMPAQIEQWVAIVILYYTFSFLFIWHGIINRHQVSLSLRAFLEWMFTVRCSCQPAFCLWSQLVSCSKIGGHLVSMFQKECC